MIADSTVQLYDAIDRWKYIIRTDGKNRCVFETTEFISSIVVWFYVYKWVSQNVSCRSYWDDRYWFHYYIQR